MSKTVKKKLIRKVQVWVVHQRSVLMLRVIGERGGGWHPITANVEKGETFLEAAKRETKEETAIRKSAGKWAELDYSFEYEGRWGHAVEHVYAMVLEERPKKIKLDPSEHTEWEWMSFARANKALHHEPQKVALGLLKKILKD